MKKILMLAMMALVGAAFADYDKDMKALYKSCTAVEWQNRHNAELAEATTPEVLAEFVADEAAAKALLAEVKGAYLTDPMKAMQIAAVTQLVMTDDESWWQWLCFWQQTREEQRKLWASALLAAARSSKDAYVTVFMLDQLRWCGYPCQVPAIAVLRASSDKAVADMAALVAFELARAK